MVLSVIAVGVNFRGHAYYAGNSFSVSYAWTCKRMQYFLCYINQTFQSLFAECEASSFKKKKNVILIHTSRFVLRFCFIKVWFFYIYIYCYNKKKDAIKKHILETLSRTELLIGGCIPLLIRDGNGWALIQHPNSFSWWTSNTHHNLHIQFSSALIIILYFGKLTLSS